MILILSQMTQNMTLILEGGSDGDSDLEIDATAHQSKPENREEEDDSDIEEESEHLLLSIEDVKVRRSSQFMTSVISLYEVVCSVKVLQSSHHQIQEFWD